MASGLSYAHFPIENNVALVIILSIVTVGFALICLYTSQEFQLKVAKLLTVLFALLMCYVAVGVAAQAGDDLYDRENPTTEIPTSSQHSAANSSTTKASPVYPTTDGLPANVSSLYLAALMGIFFLSALLHPTEAACLFHGLWYLFCLPSGYLLMIVYSICNMTDRSWGKKTNFFFSSERSTTNWLPFSCNFCPVIIERHSLRGLVNFVRVWVLSTQDNLASLTWCNYAVFPATPSSGIMLLVKVIARQVAEGEWWTKFYLVSHF